MFDKFASKLKRLQSDKQARLATALMVELIGGVERFAIAWYEQLQAAMRERPGGREAMNGLMAVARLWSACPPPPTSQLSDEELRQVMDREFQGFLDRLYPGLDSQIALALRAAYRASER